MMLKLIFIFNCLLLVTSNPLQGLQSCPLINYQQNYANSDPLARASSFDAYPQQLYYPNQWSSPQNIPHQDQSNIYYENSLVNVIPNSLIDANVPMYSQNGYNAIQYLPNLIESSPQSMNNYVIVPENYLNDQRFNNRQNPYLTSVVNGYTNENIWMPQDSNPTMNYELYDPAQQPIAYMGKNGIQNIISTQQSNTDIIPKRLKERKENENESIKCKSSKKNHKRKKITSESCKNNKNQETKSKTQTKSKSNKVIDSSLHTSQTNKSDQKLKTNKETKNTKPKTRRRSKCNKMVEENTKAKDVTVKDCALKQDINECLDINEDCSNLENRRPRNNLKTNQAQTFQQQYPNMPQDFTNNIASYLNNFMPNQNFNANLFNGNGNFPYNFDYLYQAPQQLNANTNENDRRRSNRRKKKKSKSNRQSNTSQSSNKEKNIGNNCKKVVELSTMSAETDTMTKPIYNQAKNNEREQEMIIEKIKKQKSNRESNNDHSSNKKQHFEDNCMKVVDLSPKSLEIETIIEPISNQAKNNEREQEMIIENNKKQKSNRESNNDHSSNKKQNFEDNCMKVVDLSPKSLEIETIIEPISNQNSNYKYQKQVIEVETPCKDLDIITEPNTEIIIEPLNTFLQKDDSSAVVSNEEDNPNAYDNDIYDDYYPDFTSDNIYISKEDHDWNFHDRHYYTSDNNAEMSTERRRYEPNARQSFHKHHSSHHQNDTTETVPNQKYDNIRDIKALTEEVSFKTPPGLEFPDFKTEMINKYKYTEADTVFQTNSDNNYQSEKISSFSNVKSLGNKNTKSLDNTVETVYAHSKVVKYGGSEPHAKISRKSSNASKNNNINDDKATIILAKSLNDSEKYK